MFGSRLRKLLVLVISSIALLVSADFAVAACTNLPPPPCRPTAFTGSVGAHASRCVPPPRCKRVRGPRGPRGQRGVTGKTGAEGRAGARGPIGLTGATGSTGLPGLQGTTGPGGLMGPIGLTGDTGDTGLQGVQGDAGADGVNGADGADGADGAAGPDGATGADGPAGPDGPMGPGGPAGADGLAGAQGPAGTNGLSDYAYVYNTAAAVVPIEADVPFSANGVLTAGFTHAPGSTGVTVVAAGVYKIGFSVSGVEPGQFALFVNGTLASPGTIYGSGAGTQQNTGQTILVLGAGDVLALRNHSSAAAVTLQTLAGGTQTSVNASILIEKLS